MRLPKIPGGLLAAAALVLAALFTAPAEAAPQAAKAQTACRDCHRGFAELLPPKHKAVKGDTLRACLSCHEPDAAAPAEANAYAARLHRAHATEKGKLDCLACHVLRPKGKLAVAGDKVVLPVAAGHFTRVREVTAQWAGGSLLDAAHARADVGCAGCHGPGVPADDADVDNDRCLSCHGPLDKLVAKSRPAEHPDRNPHLSHLGEIACTVCHKAHVASELYCLDCHRKFEMKLPGGGKAN